MPPISKERALEIKVGSILLFSPSKPEMLFPSSLKIYKEELSAAEYDESYHVGKLIPTKCIVKKIGDSGKGPVFFVVNLNFPYREPKPYHWTYFENGV